MTRTPAETREFMQTMEDLADEHGIMNVLSYSIEMITRHANGTDLTPLVAQLGVAFNRLHTKINAPTK